LERKRSYQTRQKELILSCLKDNADRHVTAEMIVGYLKGQGEPVGQTTVYRYLESLFHDNRVMKFEAGASACYQYVEQPEKHRNHYHLVCVACGRMIHLDCSEMDELKKHMLAEHQFVLDSFKTVLYGHCENCAGK
jgi:Fur family ferric uptake transcriptional regulator